MLELRFATAADAGVILEFVHALATYERAPDAVVVDEPTLAAQLAATPPPFECLIARQDGVSVGFALFFHSYSTWRGKRGIWLEDLFVNPEARKRGVGRALLSRVAELAVERGCARFEWTVLDWNEPAVAFYRTLGAELMTEWTACRVSDEPLLRLAGRK